MQPYECNVESCGNKIRDALRVGPEELTQVIRSYNNPSILENDLEWSNEDGNNVLYALEYGGADGIELFQMMMRTYRKMSWQRRLSLIATPNKQGLNCLHLAVDQVWPEVVNVILAQYQMILHDTATQKDADFLLYNSLSAGNSPGVIHTALKRNNVPILRKIIAIYSNFGGRIKMLEHLNKITEYHNALTAAVCANAADTIAFLLEELSTILRSPSSMIKKYKSKIKELLYTKCGSSSYSGYNAFEIAQWKNNGKIINMLRPFYKEDLLDEKDNCEQ